MKVLVTGARGMLGTDVVSVLAASHQVYATDIEDLDVRYACLVKEKLREIHPEVVVHLAALTDVDYCETYPRKAIETNVDGTSNVASCCKAIGVKVVYVSSISVFGGLKGEPYTEEDTPAPQNVYARTKYEAELILHRLSRTCCIIRTGWLFGGEGRDKKFVGTILRLARISPVLPIVCDTYGSPTYTYDLSRAIERLIATQRSGLYHAVNTGGYCTRYQLAQKVLEFAGIHSCQLVPVESAHFALQAPRPRMEAALNSRLEREGVFAMRSWTDALKEYLGRV